MSLTEIYESTIAGNAAAVREAVQREVERGRSAAEIITETLVPAMTEVGGRFERDEIFVPEMMMAAHAMRAGLGVLRPLLVEGELNALGRVVMGTVKGDLHDIGKNLVSMMLEGAGFEIVDLGIDVPPDRFVEAVREKSPDILGLSALLTTTIPGIRTTIAALVDAGVRDAVKVMVGGQPVTQAYADEVGADAYAPDAGSAVRKAKELLGIH